MAEQRRRPRRDADEDEIVDVEELPEMDTRLDNVIAVYNIPVVADKKKKDKLMKILREKFSVPDGGEVVMPSDESGALKGYAFIEYATVEEADAAIATMHNQDLDQNHRFKVCSFSAFASLDDGTIDGTYAAPAEKEIRDRVPPPPVDNLRYWVSDKLGREQFAIQYHDESAVCWHDERERPSPIQSRVRWTEAFLHWSPKGSLLTTLHAQGVATWGGSECKKIMRYEHAGVKLIDYSPNETYLVTCAPGLTGRGSQHMIMIWEVRTGRLMRGFDPPRPEDVASQWPFFQWSHDEKYLATLSGDNEHISVYETPSFKLIDGRKVQVSNVRNFEWSPTDNIIAAWVPEITAANRPARVVLIELPSRREIRQQNLFSVSDCKIYWQKKGDFLCVKVDRTTKSGKTTFTNFELFRLREREIPIEVIEFKDTVVAFEWEPCNSHFAVLHTDTPGQGRLDVSFYSMAGAKVKPVKTLEKRACTGLYWSPRGTHAVIGAVGQGTSGGNLEFISVGADGKETTVEQLDAQEHFMISNLEWDPTGRYVTTYVSFWKYQMENGYRVWTFYGRLLHEVKQDRFYQFIWRPRPQIQLSPDQEKMLAKDLHKKSKEYDRVDYAREHTMDAAAAQRRREMREAFDSIVKQRAAEHKAAHGAARRAAASDEEWSTIRMMTEEVLEEVREVIPREHNGDTDDD